MPEPTSGPKRHRCGYAVYMTLTYTDMARFYGCEQDELNGVEILRCPQCLTELDADELVDEKDFKEDGADPRATRGSRAEDARCAGGGVEPYATSKDASDKPSLSTSVAQNSPRVFTGEF